MISSNGHNITVQEVVLSPHLQLRQLAMLPSPESKYHMGHFTSATWAGDGGAVLLNMYAGARRYLAESGSSDEDEFTEAQVCMLTYAGLACDTTAQLLHKLQQCQY